MNEIQITKVNNVSIVSLSENGNKLIPIKPICEALGVDVESQRKKIFNDEILSSTTVLSTVVAADKKERVMLCLPLEFTFGWLFTINPKNVAPEAKESVTRYKLECYKALYEYFAEPQTFLAQKQKVIEKYVATYQEKKSNFKNAKTEMYEAQANLNKVMAVTIDDWRENNRQLLIPFDQQAQEGQSDE